MSANPSNDSLEEERCRLLRVLKRPFERGLLFERALTHRSAGRDNNERLEFLGDAILNFVIAETLYHRIPQGQEGLLTRKRAELVRRETLTECSREIGIGPALRLGLGELKSGGRDRDSILADAFEALVGAYYLDAGLDECRTWLLRLFDARLENVVRKEAVKDPKTDLQEILQARGLPLPVYVVTEVSGVAHEQRFTVTCEIAGVPVPARGTGSSRRKAEQAAASRSLEVLRSHYKW